MIFENEAVEVDMNLLTEIINIQQIQCCKKQNTLIISPKSNPIKNKFEIKIDEVKIKIFDQFGKFVIWRNNELKTVNDIPVEVLDL